MTTTRRILAGTTDVSVVIRIIDSADGTPETGVVFNTAGIDLEYRREGAASVDITEATLAALTTAHADGGFLHIGNGYYRLDLPDAACAAGVTGVLVHGVVTDMVVIGTYIELVAYNPYDAVRLGLTALPNAVPGAAGGIFIAGANAATSITTALTANVTGNVTGNLSGSVGSVTGAVGSVAAGGITAASLAADAITAAKIAADAVTEIQSGLATAAALTVIDDFLDTEIGTIITTLGTPAGASVSADIAAIEAQTDDIGVAGAGLTALATQASVTTIDDFLDTEIAAIITTLGTPAGVSISADIAAIEAQTDDIGAAGAGLTALGDTRIANLDATISSRASQASLDTVDNLIDTEVAAILAAVDTEIAAIKAKTDNLPASPANESTLITIAGYIDTEITDIQARLPAALVSGRMDASVGAMAAGVVTAAAVATDAIDSDAMSANAITEIQNGLATSAALALVSAFVDTEITTLQADVSAILADTGTDGVVVVTASKTGYALSAAGVDEIFDELRAGHSVVGSYGESFFTLESGAAIAGTLSTTQMSTNLTEATDDHFNGRVIIFTSGALLRQATDITAYNGTTKVPTFTALTEAPAAGDKFIIV